MMIDRCCFHVVRVALIFCGDPIGGGELWPLGPGGHWECACGPRQCQSAGCFGRRGHATGRPGCPRESGAAWSASRPGGDPGVCLSSRVARRASTGYGYGSGCRVPGPLTPAAPLRAPPWRRPPCGYARVPVVGSLACGVLFLGRVRRRFTRPRPTCCGTWGATGTRPDRLPTVVSYAFLWMVILRRHYVTLPLHKG